MSWCQQFAVVCCWAYGRERSSVEDPFDVDEGRLRDFGVERLPQGHSGHVTFEKSRDPFNICLDVENDVFCLSVCVCAPFWIFHNVIVFKLEMSLPIVFNCQLQ